MRFIAPLGALAVVAAASFAALSVNAAEQAAPKAAEPAAAKVAEQGGPTPYPKRDEDWPGRGEIRLFDFMPEYRQKFWEERQAAQGSVVFTGDSLTESWETLDADFPGLHVANRAIGGEVSRGLLFRFDEDVLALHPRAIVLLIGNNDLTASQQSSVTLENIRDMLTLRQAKAPGAPVFLTTVPSSADPKAPIDAAQRRVLNAGMYDLAKQYPNVFVVDLFAATATSKGEPDPRYFGDDLLHLSAAGHARWKQLLTPVMHQAGIL